MKPLFYLLITLFLYACQSHSGETENVNQPTDDLPTEETLPEMSGGKEGIPCNTDVMVKNSDPFTCLNYDDSLLFYYDAYTVSCINHAEMNGYVITITDLDGNVLTTTGEADGSSFFVGIYEHYAIIDQGTGQIRGLAVIDLDQNLTVLQESYIDNLTIRDGILEFEKQVELSDPELIPECPKELQGMEYGIGYVELFRFNFVEKSITGSGNYRCQYFE